jgi:hypothetical protein
MMLIFFKTIQIGFLSLIVFLALYILILFIFNFLQKKKDGVNFLRKNKKDSIIA